jgi:hypothetical protein
MSPWVLLAYPILMAWIVLGQIVRDVQQQGFESALHFWGLLILISVALGLVLGLGIVAIRRWLRGNRMPTESPKPS